MMKIQTHEMGILSVCLYREDTKEGAALKDGPFGVHIARIPPEVMEHALRGWTKPLVDILGRPPWGSLRKIPPEHRRCAHETTCASFQEKGCVLPSKNLFVCWEPHGLDPLEAEVVHLWKKGIYVLLLENR